MELENDQLELDGNAFSFLDSELTSEKSDPATFYFLQHVISKKPVSPALLNRILDYVLRNFDVFCLPSEDSNVYSDLMSLGGAVWKTLEVISAKDETRKWISKWSNFSEFLKSLNAHVNQGEVQRHKIVSVVLSNLCIDEHISEIICEQYPNWISRTFSNTIKSLGSRDFEVAKIELYMLQSISQTRTGRRLLIEALEVRDPVSPFSFLYLDVLTPEDSRQSIFGLTKNLAFDYERHEEFFEKGLIGPLLLPLVGTDVFSEKENDKMHPDWQYMDKEREQSAKVKKLIMDTLLLLCNSKSNREKLRSLNVYLILREYHLAEKNEAIIDVLENVINILLRTEEEIGVEKLNLIYDADDQNEDETIVSSVHSDKTA